MAHRSRPALCAVFGLLTALTCLVSSRPAQAQTQDRCERAKPGEHSYCFDDDLLNSDVGWGDIPTIKGPPKTTRALLIRPRVSFVQEMMKSVEHI